MTWPSKKLLAKLLKKAVGEAVEKAVGDAVEKTTKEVDKKSKLEAIRNAMQSWGLSAEEAMKGLKISPKLQREFKPLL